MFKKTLKEEKTINRIEEKNERFQGRKIVLGVERIDYTKGIPQKFKRFERFLERNPEKQDKVEFLRIGIPSSLEVREYSAYVAKTN